eukprot:9695734-Heterocapsa_arctica.AAC.1
MDIGQFDENNTNLNAFGGKGRGGKGQPKGEKEQGKGKDVQCWTCSGWGHRFNQCPNDLGKGVNE